MTTTTFSAAPGQPNIKIKSEFIFKPYINFERSHSLHYNNICMEHSTESMEEIRLLDQFTMSNNTSIMPNTYHNELNIDWGCTSCDARNTSDRNTVPCWVCGQLETELDVQRCRMYFLFGNISEPRICLLPPLTQFFIYPLNAPIVQISKIINSQFQFNVQLFDENKKQFCVQEIQIRLVCITEETDYKTEEDNDIHTILNKNEECLKNGCFNKHHICPFTTNIEYGTYRVFIKARCAEKISPSFATDLTVEKIWFAHEILWSELISNSLPSSISNSPSVYGEVKFIEMKTNSDEYQTVCNEFLMTSNLHLKAKEMEADINDNAIIHDIFIYKVMNEELSQSYSNRRTNILKSLNNDITKLNELMLWHGTAFEHISSICHQGFLRQFAGRTAFGKGMYFALTSQYSSDKRYAKLDDDGFQHVMYCSVVCGEWCVGTPNMLIPNYKLDNKNRVYETSVNNVKKPTIFVTYKDDQAKVSYIVSFRTVENINTNLNSESKWCFH